MTTIHSIYFIHHNVSYLYDTGRKTSYPVLPLPPFVSSETFILLLFPINQMIISWQPYVTHCQVDIIIIPLLWIHQLRIMEVEWFPKAM